MLTPNYSRFMPRWVRSGLLPLLSLLFLSSCSGYLQPDLERIYRPLAEKTKSTPVIFIPGIMGSQLKQGDTTFWPGSLWDLAFGSNLDQLALPVDHQDFLKNRDDLQPDGLFLAAGGENFYQEIVNTLEQTGGYHCVDPSRIKPDTNCVLFAWDWRRDLVEAAGKLDQLVEQLRTARGNEYLKVDIVAHSAGGLLTRYFLRYGSKDVLTTETPTIDHRGAYKVRKAILIGTPNYGSISALQQAITGMPVALSRIKPEVLASMPILGQLLPHPDRNWMIDINGKRIDRDIFNIETWQYNGWSIFDPRIRQRIADRFDSQTEADQYLSNLERVMTQSLQRGERFHRALSISQQDAPNKFIVFGSDCIPTPARCLLEQVGDRYLVHLSPDQIVHPKPGIDYERMMLEPGDGSVTKASLLARDSLDPTEGKYGDFRIDYEFFICEKHTKLAENITFRDNLLNILLD